LTEKPERISVQVKYKGVEEMFSAGSVEEAWLSDRGLVVEGRVAVKTGKKRENNEHAVRRASEERLGVEN